MTRTLQLLRGTTAQNDAFTGAAGEVTVDTDVNGLRVHDGSTAGGHAIYTKQQTDTLLGAKANDDAVVHLAGTETISGAKTFSSTVTVGSSSFAYNGHLELVPASSATNGGYLDFHYAGSSSDYTTRLIENASGQLSYLGNAALSSDHSTSSNVVATKGWTNATVNEMRANCITNIPQDINLELNNGTLTLKAGSKVYVPNGVGVFDAVTITNDIVAGIIGVNGQHVVIVTYDGGAISTNVPVSSCFSGPTTFFGTGMYYNTTDNNIKYYNNGTAVDIRWSFPIAIVNIVNSTIISIDQVFNGFGYIGSTIFMLPGVTLVKPNGRNADGTLKNTVSSVSAVRTNSTVRPGVSGYLIYAPSSESIQKSAARTNWTYDETTNYVRSAGGDTNWMIWGAYTTDANDKIISFEPKTAFHAVDYSDWNEHRVVEFRETSSATEYKAYRKYSDGSIDQWGFINNATWSSYQYTVTLPVAMRDALYASVATPYGNPYDDDYITNIQTQNTTTLTIRLRSGQKSCSWIVHGVAA